MHALHRTALGFIAICTVFAVVPTNIRSASADTSTSHEELVSLLPTADEFGPTASSKLGGGVPFDAFTTICENKRHPSADEVASIRFGETQYLENAVSLISFSSSRSAKDAMTTIRRRWTCDMKSGETGSAMASIPGTGTEALRLLENPGVYTVFRLRNVVAIGYVMDGDDQPAVDRALRPTVDRVAAFIKVASINYGAVEAAPIPSPSPVVSTTTQPPTDLVELQNYMQRNFAGTSWWSSIRSYELDGDAVVITVTSPTTASSICAAASGFIFSSTNRTRIDSIRVLGPEGQTLISRTPAQARTVGSCEPR